MNSTYKTNILYLLATLGGFCFWHGSQEQFVEVEADLAAVLKTNGQIETAYLSIEKLKDEYLENRDVLDASFYSKISTGMNVSTWQQFWELLGGS